MKGRGTPVQGVRSRRKSSGNLPNGEIKRKERLITKIMSRNYQQKYDTKLSETCNYEEKLSRKLYQSQGKCGNYRDTGVPKNCIFVILVINVILSKYLH